MPDNGARQILGVNPALIAPPIGVEGVIGFDVTALGNALLVSISGAPIVVNVNLDLADDEVAVGGPDSAGTRRLWQGRVDGANNIQESVSILVGAQTLTLGKAEDTPHVGGDVGVMLLGVRNDALTALAADGDYIPLMTNATGELVVTVASGGPTEFARDSAAGAADLGNMTLAVRTDAPGSSVGADGDYSPVQVDAEGALRVGGSGPTHLGKVEDSVAAAGDVGVPAYTIRRDADAPDGADGDYVALHTDALGRLKVAATGGGSQQFARDTAAGAADLGTMGLAVRKDAAGSSVGADGDYTPTQVDAEGAARVGGSGPTHLGKAEDTAHVDGDVGVPAYAVRADVPSQGAGLGDYTTLLADGSGRLHTRALQGGGTSGGLSIIAVGAAEGQILAATQTRACVTIQNRGPGPLVIRGGGAAATLGDHKLNVDEKIQFMCAAGIEWRAISTVIGASAVVQTENP